MSIYREFVKQFSCHPNLLHLTSGVTIFFATPFYLFLLFILLKNRKIEPYDSVFYRLIFLLGVIDLLSIAHTYFFLKLTEFPMFLAFYRGVFEMNSENEAIEYEELDCRKSSRCRALATYGHVAVLMLGTCQYIGITMTSLNRFTALAFTFSPLQTKVRVSVDHKFQIS